MKKFYLDRNIVLFITRDGVITYGAKTADGRWPKPDEDGLPFYAVHEPEHAKDLQLLLCKLQYGPHPDGSPCYKLYPFDGDDFEAINKASDLFHQHYMKLLDRYQREEQRRRDEQEKVSE